MLSSPAKHRNRKLLPFETWRTSHTVVPRKRSWQVADAMTSAIDPTASITNIEQWADLLLYLWVWCLLQETPGAWQCLCSRTVQHPSTTSHPVDTKSCREVPRSIKPTDLEHVSLHSKSSTMRQLQKSLNQWHCHTSYEFICLADVSVWCCTPAMKTTWHLERVFQACQVQSWHGTMLQRKWKCTLDCCSSSVVVLQYVCRFWWKHGQGLTSPSWALRSAP